MNTVNQKQDAKMTTMQLADNLMFVSAMEMLKQLLLQKALTDKEFAIAKKDFERRVRPTIITVF